MVKKPRLSHIRKQSDEVKSKETERQQRLQDAMRKRQIRTETFMKLNAGVAYFLLQHSADNDQDNYV